MDRITDGIVNVKYGYTAPTRVVEMHHASHPLPDDGGVRGTQRMLELLADPTDRDLVICLLSGVPHAW